MCSLRHRLPLSGWIAGLGSGGAAAIAVQIGRMVPTIGASADNPHRTSARVTISDRQIEITHLGRGLGSDYLFRLAELREGMEAAALQRALGLKIGRAHV